MRRTPQPSSHLLSVQGVVGVDASQTTYLNGEYLVKNPRWHVEESPWKATQILRMIQQNHLSPMTICDVGCGAGDVLKQLQNHLGNEPFFCGYEISPRALELAESRANERLQFKLLDFCEHNDGFFDLILVLDVIEHLEDYFSFLRKLRTRGDFKIFHFPLDLSAQTVLRRGALIKRREMYSHLHYFTKDTALRTLIDAGYQVLDYFYTPRSIEFAAEPGEKLLKMPRKLGFAIHPDFTARFLGGFSLLVLAH